MKIVDGGRQRVQASEAGEIREDDVDEVAEDQARPEVGHLNTIFQQFTYENEGASSASIMTGHSIEEYELWEPGDEFLLRRRLIAHLKAKSKPRKKLHCSPLDPVVIESVIQPGDDTATDESVTGGVLCRNHGGNAQFRRPEL